MSNDTAAPRKGTAFSMDEFAVEPTTPSGARKAIFPEGPKRILRALHRLLAQHGDGCTVHLTRVGADIAVTVEDFTSTVPATLKLSGEPPPGGVRLALPADAQVSFSRFTGPVKITIEPIDGLSAIIAHVPCQVVAGASPTVHPITEPDDGSRLTPDAGIAYP